MMNELINTYPTLREGVHWLLFLKQLLLRSSKIARYRQAQPLKVYYGCGDIRQPGYVNVDLRWTPAVDVIGNLTWCSRKFANRCDEVYVSHVLEHYGNPGRANRASGDTVLGALQKIHTMIKPGGGVRLAVPDFRALARLYIEKHLPLNPRLLGRVYGEQDYPQNYHKCGFDIDFLSCCLQETGFEDIHEWLPEQCGIVRDSSFDHIDGVRTSLNLVATKI